MDLKVSHDMTCHDLNSVSNMTCHCIYIT